MSRELRYFALEFRGDQLVRRHEFTCAVDAEEGAQMIARLATGAVAYQQWCDEEMGDFDDPELLLVAGQIRKAWLPGMGVDSEAA